VSQARLNAARILILDDEVASACLLANFLNRLGYQNIETLNDPEQVFDKVAVFRPDLILLDLSMPKLDGFQVIELLRKDIPPAAWIPVIVITGDATSANKRRALAAGVMDLLAKPFDASEAYMRIRNVIERRILQMQIEEQNRSLEQRVSERTEQLQQALGDLQTAQRQMLKQERLSAFAEMAGGVVHDFSNALMAVIGYSDILMAGNGRNLEKRDCALEYLQIINTAGRDAAEVVSRLRDFYRPRNHAETSQAVDLNDAVHQAVLLTQPKWKDVARESDKKITVEAEWNDLPIVSGNPAELREMLTNLIFNAVDALPDGGTVKLRTRQFDDHVLIEVADSGMGMTAEVRARCMDPFFSTKGDKGTGLGLAMVFGIVQRHQGSIEIESELGCGTTFRITLPTPVRDESDITVAA
jgi:signal transduction histidine kinase